MIYGEKYILGRVVFLREFAELFWKHKTFMNTNREKVPFWVNLETEKIWNNFSCYKFSWENSTWKVLNFGLPDLDLHFFFSLMKTVATHSPLLVYL